MDERRVIPLKLSYRDEADFDDEEKGLENLGANDDDEVSLGNFFIDLEKHP